LTRRLLPQNLGYDWWSFAGNKTGGGGRWGGDRQMDGLIRPKNMRRGDAGASGADIEGLGELNEFDPGHISPPEEDGHLETDARRASGRRNLHEPALYEKVGVQVFSLSWYQGTSTHACIWNAREESQEFQ